MSARPDQMICPACGGTAESDSVDIGVGTMVRGNFACPCGWQKVEEPDPDDFWLCCEDEEWG